jgi:FKBP-type peptidyl-prolyl cis-trans isomerase 2
MQIVQAGDHVQVHYVKRFEDGTVRSSRQPLEVTVGVDHPLLPGLGLALVGLSPGESTRIRVPADDVPQPVPARILRLARTRLPEQLTVGARVQVVNRHGRRRLVRIVEIHDKLVVATHHHASGLAMELKVQLVAIHVAKDRNGAGAEAGHTSL